MRHALIESKRMPSFLNLPLVAACLFLLTSGAQAADCNAVATRFSSSLQSPVNAAQLAATLQSLNESGRLPDSYVTKREAGNAGWRPGKPLWSVPGLQGKSIGGDRFGNFERRLPKGDWREADLDYRGGKRGAKRLIFAPRRDGKRFVTVDHYATFQEVPSCR